MLKSLVSKVTHFRDSVVKAVVGPQSRRSHAKMEAIPALESRKLPAAIIAGNLQIVGTNFNDNVRVDDIYVNGWATIRVIQNGYTQLFYQNSFGGQVQFFGNAGNDVFSYYGIRNCFIDGGTGSDYLSGGAGWDVIYGGDGNDTLEGWNGNDLLYGGYGNDLLDGGNGNDSLYGEWGNDMLGGGAGNDLLNGGFGYDVAFGGSGYDTFQEVGYDPSGVLYWPAQTRFGIQYRSAGVQDFNGYYDYVNS